MIKVSINTVIPKSLTIEQIANERQLQINIESLEYLNSTDWYITRFAELAVPIPQSILDNRKNARLNIIRGLSNAS